MESSAKQSNGQAEEPSIPQHVKPTPSPSTANGQTSLNAAPVGADQPAARDPAKPDARLSNGHMHDKQPANGGSVAFAPGHKPGGNSSLLDQQQPAAKTTSGPTASSQQQPAVAVNSQATTAVASASTSQQGSEAQPAPAPVASTSSQPSQTSAQNSTLPSGALMLPYSAGTLSSPQSSPVHTPAALSTAQAPNQTQQQPQQQPQQQQAPQRQQSLQQQQQLQQQQIRQQQALMQQQRYQYALHQAQLQQAALQRPQAEQLQQGMPTRPLMHNPLLLPNQQQQQLRLPTAVMQPRAAQPVWPVPLPRTASGQAQHLAMHHLKNLYMLHVCFARLQHNS